MSARQRPAAPLRAADPRGPWLSPEDFARAVRANAAAPVGVVGLTAAVDQAKDRIFDFTAATSSANRNGWRVDPAGWDFAAFRQNPVVLWSHDDSVLPLGRALDIRLERDRLRARVEFTAEGLLTFNDRVVDLLRAGFLRGMSVGILPEDWKWEGADGDQRMVFLKVQLLELSIVNIPADAGALADAASTSAAVAARQRALVTVRRQLVRAVTEAIDEVEYVVIKRDAIALMYGSSREAATAVASVEAREAAHQRGSVPGSLEWRRHRIRELSTER